MRRAVTRLAHAHVRRGDPRPRLPPAGLERDGPLRVVEGLAPPPLREVDGGAVAEQSGVSGSDLDRARVGLEGLRGATGGRMPLEGVMMETPLAGQGKNEDDGMHSD